MTIAQILQCKKSKSSNQIQWVTLTFDLAFRSAIR